MVSWEKFNSMLLPWKSIVLRQLESAAMAMRSKKNWTFFISTKLLMYFCTRNEVVMNIYHIFAVHKETGVWAKTQAIK